MWPSWSHWNFYLYITSWHNKSQTAYDNELSCGVHWYNLKSPKNENVFPIDILRNKKTLVPISNWYEKVSDSLQIEKLDLPIVHPMHSKCKCQGHMTSMPLTQPTFCDWNVFCITQWEGRQARMSLVRQVLPVIYICMENPQKWKWKALPADSTVVNLESSHVTFFEFHMWPPFTHQPKCPNCQKLLSQILCSITK